MRTDELQDRDGDSHIYIYSDSKNLHKYVVRHMHDTSQSNFTYTHTSRYTKLPWERLFLLSFSLPLLLLRLLVLRLFPLQMCSDCYFAPQILYFVILISISLSHFFISWFVYTLCCFLFFFVFQRTHLYRFIENNANQGLMAMNEIYFQFIFFWIV